MDTKKIDLNSLDRIKSESQKSDKEPPKDPNKGAPVTTFDEKSQIYTKTSFSVTSGGQEVKETIKYRLNTESKMIPKAVLLRRNLLENKFRDKSLHSAFKPSEELIEFHFAEEKKAREPDLTLVQSVRCHLCKGDHYTSICSNTPSEPGEKFKLGEVDREIAPARTVAVDHSPVIRVNNFPVETTPDDLNELFRPFGVVKQIKIAMDRKTNISRGYGFVTFKHKAEANKAMETVQGHRYGRMVLNLEWGKTISEMLAEREARGQSKKNFGAFRK